MRILSLFLCLAMTLPSFAQVESQINFRGQNSDVFKIDKSINVTRQVTYEAPSTCTRDVPYQERECRNVTRTREECQEVPSQRECHTQYESVCRNVTRTREECTNGPSRQVCNPVPTREVCTPVPTRQVCRPGASRRVCTQNPSRQVCTNGPATQSCRPGPATQSCRPGPATQSCRPGPNQQVCTPKPSREVCVERPTREVCRVNGQGQNVCQTVGGGQSCQTVGGGETCVSKPGPQVCSSTPGPQVCSSTPGPQVCTSQPGPQSCQTVGGGERCTDVAGPEICQTVGGGQNCQTVGGGQSCHTVPGAQTCRNVNYTDQECVDVPRERCETIPSHRECNQIPYSEEVCSDETRTRQEQYACTRPAQRDETSVKKLVGDIQVHFETNGLVEEFPLKLNLNPVDVRVLAFTSALNLMKEPKILVVLKKKEIVSTEKNNEIVVQGDIVIELLDPKMAGPTLPNDLKNASFNKSNSIFTLDIEGLISAQGSIEALFETKRLIGRKKTVAEVKANFPSDLVKIQGNKLVINLANQMQREFAKKNQVSVKLTAPVSVKGELLNAVRPFQDQSYQILFAK